MHWNSFRNLFLLFLIIHLKLITILFSYNRKFVVFFKLISGMFLIVILLGFGLIFMPKSYLIYINY